MDQKLSKLIVLSGTVGISFAAIFVRFSTAPAPVLVVYRMAITALLLTVPVLADSEHRRELTSLDPRIRLCCIVSGLFLALHFVTYFRSVHETSVASAVLMTDMEVFFTGLAGFLFFGERISGRSIAGILIAITGCVIIALSDLGTGAHMLRGDLLALFSGLAMAVYTMMGRICRQQISTSVYTWIVYLITALTALLYLILTGTPVLGYEPINWLTTLGMAVFSTLLGHNIFSWGLKYHSAATVSTLKLAEPVFSALLAVVFFREIPTWTAVVGSVVIIFGIWWYIKNSDQ